MDNRWTSWKSVRRTLSNISNRSRAPQSPDITSMEVTHISPCSTISRSESVKSLRIKRKPDYESKALPAEPRTPPPDIEFFPSQPVSPTPPLKDWIQNAPCDCCEPRYIPQKPAPTPPASPPASRSNIEPKPFLKLAPKEEPEDIKSEKSVKEKEEEDKMAPLPDPYTARNMPYQKHMGLKREWSSFSRTSVDFFRRSASKPFLKSPLSKKREALPPCPPSPVSSHEEKPKPASPTLKSRFKRILSKAWLPGERWTKRRKQTEPVVEQEPVIEDDQASSFNIDHSSLLDSASVFLNGEDDQESISSWSDLVREIAEGRSLS